MTDQVKSETSTVATKTGNTAAAISTPTQTHNKPTSDESSQKAPSIPKEWLLRFATEASKLAFVAVFMLYVIGFVIWHAYLSRFGVSLGGVWQTEFLSAALCYLALLACFALPPGIMLYVGERKIAGFPYAFFAAGWFVLLKFSTPLFFPDKRETWIPFFVVAGIAAVHCIYLILTIKWNPHPKVRSFLYGKGWFAFYFLLHYAISLPFNNSVNILFIFMTLILYLIKDRSELGIPSAQELWKHPSIPSKILAAIIIGFLVLSHIYLFGRLQFGLIPRTVGGGMGECAMLKLNEKGTQLAQVFNLPSTNGLVGPIRILIKTERNLVFVSATENVRGILPGQEVRSDLVDGIIFLPSPEPKVSLW